MNILDHYLTWLGLAVWIVMILIAVDAYRFERAMKRRHEEMSRRLAEWFPEERPTEHTEDTEGRGQ